jgi:hypothetical protein
MGWEMTAQARGWEQRILPAATEATNGAWLINKRAILRQCVLRHTVLADLGRYPRHRGTPKNATWVAREGRSLNCWP